VSAYWWMLGRRLFQQGVTQELEPSNTLLCFHAELTLWVRSAARLVFLGTSCWIEYATARWCTSCSLTRCLPEPPFAPPLALDAKELQRHLG
jgi:hypothetical protein